LALSMADVLFENVDASLDGCISYLGKGGLLYLYFCAD